VQRWCSVLLNTEDGINRQHLIVQEHGGVRV
jgi:hypothetical protein